MAASGTRFIIVYLAITFGWTWLFWGSAALQHTGVVMLPAGMSDFLMSPLNPAAWGPLVAAVIVSFLAGGIAGVGRLLRRGIAFRFGWVWYLVIFLTFPVLIGGALLIAVLLGDPVPEMPALAEPAILPIAFLVILLLNGPLQEEFGWRGILQDQLQEKLGATVAAIGTGIVWGLWHLPLFYMPSSGPYYERPLWGLVLSTTLISVLFAWIFNNVGKSIAAMILFHTMYNFSHYVFPALQSDRAGLILFGLQIVMALAVVLIFGAQRLSRQPRT